jgi:predicted nucleic acid-binding protein
MIVLDTSVLSRSLRRRRAAEASDPVAAKLAELLRDNVPVAIPGIVLQEILSGVRTEEQLLELQERLDPFPILLASKEHHTAAARLTNQCRARGISVGTIDALIASIVLTEKGVLFTVDRDFNRIAKVVPLQIYDPGASAE